MLSDVVNALFLSFIVLDALWPSVLPDPTWTEPSMMEMPLVMKKSKVYTNVQQTASTYRPFNIPSGSWMCARTLSTLLLTNLISFNIDFCLIVTWYSCVESLTPWFAICNHWFLEGHLTCMYICIYIHICIYLWIYLHDMCIWIILLWKTHNHYVWWLAFISTQTHKQTKAPYTHIQLDLRLCPSLPACCLLGVFYQGTVTASATL